MVKDSVGDGASVECKEGSVDDDLSLSQNIGTCELKSG
jgi:hypothetical protein